MNHMMGLQALRIATPRMRTLALITDQQGKTQQSQQGKAQQGQRAYRDDH